MIVPIVAAALADRSRLTRVVVLKPLARQMFRLLCRTLGGVTNRRVFYLPVDRSLRLTPGLVEKIHDLFMECMEVGGILLCQPEHLLLFKLMAHENLSKVPILSALPISPSCTEAARRNARDILEESDEILSPISGRNAFPVFGSRPTSWELSRGLVDHIHPPPYWTISCVP